MTTRLAVRVQPGARHEGIRGRLADGTWRLAVTAKPEAGRANRAVEVLLAGLLGVPAGQVEVARGAASRAKWVTIEGLGAAEVDRRLAASLAISKARNE